jgi:hypothetical protein
MFMKTACDDINKKINRWYKAWPAAYSQAIYCIRFIHHRLRLLSYLLLFLYIASSAAASSATFPRKVWKPCFTLRHFARRRELGCRCWGGGLPFHKAVAMTQGVFWNNQNCTTENLVKFRRSLVVPTLNLYSVQSKARFLSVWLLCFFFHLRRPPFFFEAAFQS